MLESWTREDFVPRVGEIFHVDLGAGPVVFHLAEVRKGAVPPRGRPQFSLLFRGPQTAQLRQGTFAVTHAELGTHELFLVPVGVDRPESDAEGGGVRVLYEAVFT